MNRFLILIYGIVAYALALASILYAVGFVGNLVVPKSIDVGGTWPWPQAVLTNFVLLIVFAGQHSVMARQGFKRWWTRIIPQSIERSTYVLTSALIMFALFWLWVPIPERVWNINSSASATLLIIVYFVGWGLVLVSTFLIDHFNLFGLSQVFAAWRGRQTTDPKFHTPFLYKIVRHPLYLGFLLAFWAAPIMTVGHLIFALGTTAYIFIGILLEERDMISLHGDTYRKYRQRVRMILPLPVGRSQPTTDREP